MSTQLFAKKIALAQQHQKQKIVTSMAKAAAIRGNARKLAAQQQLQKVAVNQNIAVAKAKVNKASAQRGAALQNAEKAIRQEGQLKQVVFKEAWKAAADANVEDLAKQQMQAWTKINPTWVQHMPGDSAQSATISTKHGVAGENFQAPSGPPPAVTAVTGTYDSLKPKSGSAVSTYVETLVEETIPMVSKANAPKAQVAAPASSDIPWGKIGLGLTAAYLLLRKKR